MTGLLPRLSPEVCALLGRERGIPPLPPTVRTRGLARARAALRAGRAAASEMPRGAGRARWAAAAALVCVTSAGAGVAAYAVRALSRLPPGVPAIAPEVEATAPPSPAPARIGDVQSALTRELPTPRSSPPDSLRVEMRLLARARAAVAREDFAAALPPIAEHARRFKNGQLAEEREALRVKALGELGRTEEARRAGAGFGERFPSSVLRPALEMPATRP